MFSRRVISLLCRQPRSLPQSRFLSTTPLTYQKSPEDNVAIAAQKIREKATFDTFKIFDKDNSGFITHDEFEQVAIELDVEVTHEQITEIMSKIDHDKDGKVCYKEFLEGKERGDLEDFKILEKLSKLTLGPGGWGGVGKLSFLFLKANLLIITIPKNTTKS